jgi:ketosteroid isomerase-like protein
MIRTSLVIPGVMAAAAALGQTPAAAPDPARAAIQAELWSKEQAIYAGRARGDLTPYVANTSKLYVSWPPTVKAPMDYAKLAMSTPPPGNDHERLTMTFMDLALSGDTAVIYYRNHMTMRADGTPVDLTYDVAHTWTREGGVWRVLGGMARLEPPAKPAP